MRTIELVLNTIYILGGLVLLALTIRYPRAVFVEIPMAILGALFHPLTELALLLTGVIGVTGTILGKDLNNVYRTKGKRFLTFARCKKFLLTTGTDEGMVKIKVVEFIEATNEKLRIDEFQFASKSEQTITIPPNNISFLEFNYLIQWLTDRKVKSVGLVESTRMAYAVYDDPETENLIGQTDRGEKFFISLVDNFDKRQFLRINNEIELLEEYDISRIKNELSIQLK